MAQTASGDEWEVDSESGDGGEAVFEALAELEGLVESFALTAFSTGDELDEEVRRVVFEYDWVVNNAWIRDVEAFLEDVAGAEAAEPALESGVEEMVSKWSGEQGGGLTCAGTGSKEAAKRCAMMMLAAGGRVCDVSRMVVRWRRKKRRSLRAMRVRREVSEKKAEWEEKGKKCQQRLQVLKVLGRFRQWQRHGRHRWESRKQGAEMVDQGRVAWENRVVRRVWSWWNWRLVEGGRKKVRWTDFRENDDETQRWLMSRGLEQRPVSDRVMWVNRYCQSKHFYEKVAERTWEYMSGGGRTERGTGQVLMYNAVVKLSTGVDMELVQEAMEANWEESFQFDGHFFAEVRRRYDQYRRKWGEPEETVSMQELRSKLAEESRQRKKWIAGVLDGTITRETIMREKERGKSRGGARTPRVRGVGN